jgi:hypothetical protein
MIVADCTDAWTERNPDWREKTYITELVIHSLLVAEKIKRVMTLRPRCTAEEKLLLNKARTSRLGNEFAKIHLEAVGRRLTQYPADNANVPHCERRALISRDFKLLVTSNKSASLIGGAFSYFGGRMVAG